MRRFLLFFRQFQKLLATSNTCISVNIARKIKCYILKSKLIICEYNGFYFSEIAFIGFTLHEIKEGIVFFGTLGIYIYIYIVFRFTSKNHNSLFHPYRNRQVVSNFENVCCFYAIERMRGMRVGETMLRRNN